MKPHTFMHPETISLSPNLSRKYNQTSVKAITYYGGKGDGWVENTPGNVLSGKLAVMRKNNNVVGPRHYYQFIPIENALDQYDAVKDSNQLAIDQIEGHISESGQYVPGELDKIRWTRERLPLWLMLDESEKVLIGNVYGGMSDDRRHSKNIINVMIHNLAGLMRNIEDVTGRRNPSATMARSLKLEGYGQDRLHQLLEVASANESRGLGVTAWIWQENNLMGQAHEILTRLIDPGQDEDLDSLMLVVQFLKFRVTVFNQLAYNLSKTHNRVEDPAVLDTTLAGIQFSRASNYLIKPFSELAKHSERPENSDKFDKNVAETLQRINFLESMTIGEPFNTLKNRIIEIGDALVSAAKNHDPRLTRRNAKQAKWLVNYMCLPTKDPEIVKWYGHRLRPLA